MKLLGVLLGSLTIVGAAQATLIDRGGGLIYDDVLNVTWLQDANLAASNSFGLAYGTDLGVHPADSHGYSSNYIFNTGLATWGGALHWIDAMNAANYLGYHDWRLPTMIDTEQPGCNFSYSVADCGYNVLTVDANTQPVTIYSELAHMYYSNFNNIAMYTSSGTYQPGHGLVDEISNPTDESLFINVMSNGPYWSGLEYAPAANSAWAWQFYMRDGSQGAGFKDNASLFVWAVRDGDVAATSVPEPAIIPLMLTGLAALGVAIRKRRANWVL